MASRQRKLNEKLLMKKHKQQVTKVLIRKKPKRNLETFDEVLQEIEAKFPHLKEDLFVFKFIGLEISCLKPEIDNTEQEFSEDLRGFALSLYYYSPQAYNHVRSTFNTCLPHPSVIKQWFEKSGGNPGFTAEAFTALKLKSQTAKVPVIANLSLAEMELNQLCGDYVDVGNEFDTDCNEEARFALVFVVTAINGSWKIPVAYFLIKVMTGSQRAEFLKMCLEKLHNSGIKVASVSFNADYYNFLMLEELGGSIENPTFYHPVTSSPVACFLEPTRLVYHVQMTLHSLKILLDGIGRNIRWEHLDTLNALQKKKQLMLGQKPVVLFHNQENKVNAAQLFDSSVSDALDACRKRKLPKFQDSKGTAEFLRIINNLIDILSSRNLHHGGFIRALNFENESELLGYIDQCINYINGLKCQDGSSVLNVPKLRGFPGLLANAQTVKMLYASLIETGQLSYLPLYKLSLHQTKLFFENVKKACNVPTNRYPTVPQFKESYIKLLKIKEQGRWSAIENISFMLHVSAVDRINVTTYNPRVSEYADEDKQKKAHKTDPLIDKVTDYDSDMMKYVAASLVAELIIDLNCITCIGALVTSKGDVVHNFIVAKGRNGLLYPSKHTIKICEITECVIRTNYLNKSKQFMVAKVKNKTLVPYIVAKVMRQLVQTNIFNDICFHQINDFPSANHVTDLMKAIVESYTGKRLQNNIKKCKRSLDCRLRLF